MASYLRKIYFLSKLIHGGNGSNNSYFKTSNNKSQIKSKESHQLFHVCQC